MKTDGKKEDIKRKNEKLIKRTRVKTFLNAVYTKPKINK